MTAFCFSSRKFLIVFYGGTIFPDILRRKENDLFFQKNIQDVYESDTPSVQEVPMRELQVIVQKVFEQKRVV